MLVFKTMNFIIVNLIKGMFLDIFKKIELENNTLEILAFLIVRSC